MASPWDDLFGARGSTPTNPWSDLFSSQPEEEEPEDPLERMRWRQRRMIEAGGMPALGEDEDEERRSYGPWDSPAMRRFGTAVAEGVSSLADLPGVVASLAAAAPTTRPSSFGTPEPGEEEERQAARAGGALETVESLTPEPIRRTREAVRSAYEREKETYAEEQHRRGTNPWVAALKDTGLEAASLIADPTNLIPADVALKGARALGRGGERLLGRAGREAAERLGPRIADLSEASDMASVARSLNAGVVQEVGLTSKGTEWTGRVLESVDQYTADVARPGVSVAERELPSLGTNGIAIAYRSPDGRVIAGVNAIMSPEGAVQVSDLAVDEGAGLLKGRALLSVGEELSKRGPVDFMSDLSPDAFRIIKKAVDRGRLELTEESAGQLEKLRRARAAEALIGPEVHVESAARAGEAGFVRVRANSAPGSPSFYQKWFTNWGDYAAMGRELGEATAEAKRLTGAAIKTEGKRAEMVVRDAAAEIKRHQKALARAGMDRPLDETLDYVLSGLEGEHAFQGAETLGERVAAARDHLDSLSRDFEAELTDLIRKDLIKSPEWLERAKELRVIVKNNIGKWNRRSFEAFRNADWEGLVKAPDSPERWRWDGFVEWAKKEISSKEPGLSDEVLQARAEGLGNKYLRRNPEVFLGFGERTLIPTERLGSARKRLDLPQQIDDLLGLDKDPLVRYRESVLSLAHDIETLKFKKNLLEQGQGKIFFDEAMGEASAQIRGTTGLDPLAGKYTFPEVQAVIAAATDGAREAAGLLAKTSSMVKAGKTVFSPFVTHPRNLFSWIPMITANGNTIAAFNPMRLARSAATVASGKIAKGGALERGLNAVAKVIRLADGRRLSEVVDYSSLDYLRERLLKLQRAGVVGESTTAGDVGHYLGVAGQVKSLNALKNAGPYKGLGKFGRAMEWMYGAEDDLGKLVAFDALEKDLSWAMDGASADEVFSEATRRIRDTTPTYSKIAPATRKLRDNPLLSAFPTFTQEVYRNYKNGLKLALSDLRDPNPKMRLLGAKRFGGLVTAAGSAAAIAAAGRKATGISEEGVDALREFVAPWDRNAELAPVSVDGYKVQTVNLSYMMPHSIFSEPLVAAMAQLRQNEGPIEDIVEATLGAAWEAGEPFLSREIVIDGILDYAVETEGKFWNKNQPVDVNARAVSNAIWRTAAPGGLLWIERVVKAAGGGEKLEEMAADMPSEEPSQEVVEFVASLLQQKNQYGREYKLDEELVAGGTGIRRMTYDVYEGLGFKARAFKANYSEASADKNRAKNHPSKLPPSTLLERRREANQQVYEGWLELRRAVVAMRKIGEESGKAPGIVDRDIRKKLGEERMSKKWIDSVLRGSFVEPF